MTDEQINGAAAQVQGKAQKAFGNLVGDQQLQVEGAVNDAKGRSRRCGSVWRAAARTCRPIAINSAARF